MDVSTTHLLKQLHLPDRFESLYSQLGPEVARILVAPTERVVRDFQTAALATRARSEGLFVPLYGKSGTGKTTLASSLTTFLPSQYTDSVTYTGEITFDNLNDAVRNLANTLPATDTRIIPLNLDHRESDPPASKELATIKRFLRGSSLGSRSIVLWPETSKHLADEIARNYIEIAGSTAIQLPLAVEGPPISTWPEIATNTLELVNSASSLVDLGVNPQDYSAADFTSIGHFLRVISNDFTKRLSDLLSSTRKPLSLIIVFASESTDLGILSQLVDSAHFGLLNGHALLDATSGSEVGKWWRTRKGLLTQTIFQLNAHAFCLPPTASVTILRHFASPRTQEVLNNQGVIRRGPHRVIRDLARTDFGRYLAGQFSAAFSNRGETLGRSAAYFAALAQAGFTQGKDKTLNHAMAEAYKYLLESNNISFEDITSEKKLDFCPLIPDNAINYADQIVCIEYTWRSGNYLSSTYRSEIAQYILTKLRNYARELEWVAE